MIRTRTVFENMFGQQAVLFSAAEPDRALALLGQLPADWGKHEIQAEDNPRLSQRVRLRASRRLSTKPSQARPIIRGKVRYSLR